MALLLAYGSMVLIIKAAGEGLCEAVNDEAKMDDAAPYEQLMYGTVEDTVVEIDDIIASTIDTNMCTEACPCYRGDNDENYDMYMALGELEVNKFGRTLESEDIMDEEADDGETVKYIALVWGDERLDEYAQYLSYTNLYECAEDLDRKAADAKREYEEETGQEWEGQEPERIEMTEQNKKLIKYFESTFACSGICKSNLFYWMAPISAGPPKSACLNSLWEKISDIML